MDVHFLPAIKHAAGPQVTFGHIFIRQVQNMRINKKVETQGESTSDGFINATAIDFPVC